MFIVFGRDISLVLRTSEISLLKNNSHDLHRVITHSFVLVIVSLSYLIWSLSTYFQIPVMIMIIINVILHLLKENRFSFKCALPTLNKISFNLTPDEN